MNKESLISVNMNFSNGSGHTASTTSVINAKDIEVGGESLGTVIGEIGSRVDFSDPRINKLFSQFQSTEKTTSKDGTKTTISRKFSDITSLKLKSHFIAVRGKDTSPKGAGSFDGVVYDYSECPNSPVPSFGKQFPRKVGGGLIIGNIYNEISDTDEITGDKISLIYQGGVLDTNLSYNSASGEVSSYSNNPDLSKSEIKYGYKLRELITALGMAGIPVIGLPSRDDVLFENSGTVDSVLSSIASSLGLYWYVNPLNSTVVFISSAIAVTYQITNPLTLTGGNLKSCSFTENALAPVIANSYMTNTAPIKSTPDESSKQRIARFKPVDILGKIGNLSIPKETYKVFYGAECSGALTPLVFDAISYKLATENKPPDFGKFYDPAFQLSNKTVKDWSELYIASEKTADSAAAAYKGPLQLKKCKYIDTRSAGAGSSDNLKPSNSKAYQVIKDAFFYLNNSIYISNQFSKRKAERMQFSSNDLSISGPYETDIKVNKIEGLKKVVSLLRANGVKTDNFTLDNIIEATEGVKGSGGYVFIGQKAVANNNVVQGDDKDDYIDFTNENISSYTHTTGLPYYAILAELFDTKIPKSIAKSKSLFGKRRSKDDLLESLRCPYTRTKLPVNEILGNRKAEQELDDADAEEDEQTSQITDLFDKKNYVQTSLLLNGASGNMKTPVSFDVKKGKGVEINALKNFNYGGRSKTFLQSSSRTIVGLFVPTQFSIVMSGLSYSLSGGSLTTTIKESTQKLLPIDDTIVVGDSMRSYRTSSISSRFSAAQKNFLGL
jgi:hypothetical protein